MSQRVQIRISAFAGIGTELAGLDRLKRLVRAGVRAALSRHDIQAARITVVLVNDETIAALHRRFLQRRSPTDVLAFDLRDASDGSDEGSFVEGEIIISIDTARRAARQRGHPVESELALYAVHGTLHLLGYDDDTPRNGARMHKLEDEILTAIGLGVVYEVPTPRRPKGYRHQAKGTAKVCHRSEPRP